MYLWLFIRTSFNFQVTCLFEIFLSIVSVRELGTHLLSPSELNVECRPVSHQNHPCAFITFSAGGGGSIVLRNSFLQVLLCSSLLVLVVSYKSMGAVFSVLCFEQIEEMISPSSKIHTKKGRISSQTVTYHSNNPSFFFIDSSLQESLRYSGWSVFIFLLVAKREWEFCVFSVFVIIT